MKRLFLLLFSVIIVSNVFAVGKSDILVTNTAGATLTFSSSNTYEWEWDSSNKRLRSTNLNVANSTSQTTITVNLVTDAKLAFDYIVSSESGYDKFYVSIDGSTVINGESGSVSSSFSKGLTTGEHTVILKYVKDSSTDNGTDRAYISNMSITSTAITYNTTSELTGMTGVTEIFCSAAGQLEKLFEFANSPRKLRITGKIAMTDFDSYLSDVKYLDLSDATIVECQSAYHHTYGGAGFSGSGKAGELVTGLIIYNGGQDGVDYSSLRILVLPDNCTRFVCNHNANSEWYEYYLTDIYSRSTTPVNGINSYTYAGGVLHVPSGSKEAWSAVASKFTVVADTPEKVVTTTYRGSLSNYLSTTEQNNVDVLTVKGYLNAEDFALIKRMPQLNKLDISGAVITSYSGTDGPNKSVLNYEADEIPAYSFQNNSSIKYIITKAHSVGANSFQNCTSIISLEFSYSDNKSYKIKDYAFDGSILAGYNLIFPSSSSWGGISGVCYIGDFAFRNTQISSIPLYSSVTGIGKNPFLGNKTQNEVYEHYYYDDSYIRYDVDGIMFDEKYKSQYPYSCTDQLIYSAEGTKLMASALSEQKSIMVKDVTHTINDYALSELPSVTDITLGRNVETIGEAFMYGCPKLTSITVDDNNIFYKVQNKVLYSKDGTELVRYPANAGSECEIADKTQSIRSMAFEGSKLSNLTVMANVPPKLPTDAFLNADTSNLKVYVNAASLNDYKSDPEWKKFDLQVMPDEHVILVTDLVLDNSALTLEVGDVKTLSATVSPDSADNRTISWVSSNESVATIDSNGAVTAISIGTTTVTASTNDGSKLSVSCNITVVAKTDADTDLSTYENVVYFENDTAFSGRMSTLSLKMNNVIAPTGFQCDVYLPSGVEFAKDNDEFYLVNLSTARTTAQKTNYFDCSLQADGALRIMCSSTKNYTFSGNDGEVATITVNVSSDMKEGEYPLIIKNIVLSDANAKTYKVQYVKTTLAVSTYTLGDANGDGEINVGDFTAIASRIMGNPPASFVEKAADVNEDGEINVGDLTGVATIILHGSQKAPMRENFAVGGFKEPSISAADCFVAEGQEFTVDVRIGGSQNFSGYQFDMMLPEGLTVKSCESASGKPFFSTSIVGEKTLRVLSATTNGTPVRDDDDCVARITFVANAELSQPVCIENVMISQNGSVINVAPTTFKVSTSGAVTNVEDYKSAQTPVEVYDLLGRRISADSVESLDRGIYIVNGKKFVK